jgi:hypothetical protein
MNLKLFNDVFLELKHGLFLIDKHVKQLLHFILKMDDVFVGHASDEQLNLILSWNRRGSEFEMQRSSAQNSVFIQWGS